MIPDVIISARTTNATGIRPDPNVTTIQEHDISGHDADADDL